MDEPQLKVELLCAHHTLDKFDCGYEESNRLASGLLSQVQEGREWRYNNAFLAVVVVDGRKVVGIAAACSVHLDADTDADGELVHGKCLFYYLLATDHSPGGNRMAVLKHLRDEMDGIQTLLLPSGAYIGEMAVPDRPGDPVHVARLVKWLEHQRFRPLGTKPYIWFRPMTEAPSAAGGPSA